ncbi:MAG: molybdopterin-binding protein [Desulfosoma sp.]
MEKMDKVWKPAVVTVGQEVLYGERPNDNLTWLLRTFVSFGHPAVVAMVLPDDERVIGDHLAILVHQGYRPVFVSGGIGGTHDDRTRQGIALGLGRPLVRHEECFQRLARRYGRKFTDQRQRMAWLPEGAKLIDNPIGAPGFSVDAVYAFPGFPEMLHPMAQETLKRLFGPPVSLENQVLELTLGVSEGVIAEEVERFALEYPKVQIGLYPSLSSQGATVTVRCRHFNATPQDWAAAEDFLKNLERSYPVIKSVTSSPQCAVNGKAP